MSERKSYLGDAVYVDMDRFGRVILTTEDGYSATNTIVLDPEVVRALEFWLQGMRVLHSRQESE